jgi:hypothetical protein
MKQFVSRQVDCRYLHCMSDEQSRLISCPTCGQALDVTQIAAPIVQCSHCGHQVMVALDDSDAPASPEPDENVKLDRIHIERVFAVRSASMKSRRLAMIGMLCCAGAVVQSVSLLVRHAIHFGWDWWQLLYIAIAIAGSWGGAHFWQSAVKYQREAQETRLPPPTAPPDFSTLSDGSQRWKDLEQL